MLCKIGTNIQEAAALLNQGQTVAIPTETVYGLAAQAFQEDAILKVFSVKNRPHFDPLIVHVHSIEAALPLVTHIPTTAAKLLQHFSPGPLTLLLPKSDLISDLITAGSPYVALRIPNHPLTLQLLKELNAPLVAPSANPFGYISPTSAAHVFDQLSKKIPYILDGGSCLIGVESTIIGFHTEKPTLCRYGGVPAEKITECIGAINYLTHSSTPQAPGQLKSHYSPTKSFILGDLSNLLKEHSHRKIGVLTFQNTIASIEHQVQLAPDGSLTTAAKNLFAAMRTLDALPIDLILAERVPDFGLGSAINDRLTRAAAK